MQRCDRTSSRSVNISQRKLLTLVRSRMLYWPSFPLLIIRLQFVIMASTCCGVQGKHNPSFSNTIPANLSGQIKATYPIDQVPNVVTAWLSATDPHDLVPSDVPHIFLTTPIGDKLSILLKHKTKINKHIRNAIYLLIRR